MAAKQAKKAAKPRKPLLPKGGTVRLTIRGNKGLIRPATILVRIRSGKTDQEQAFANLTDAPVTVMFPCGLSPDGCIFGIAPRQTVRIRISACAPRRIEIPYCVFFADANVRDWGFGDMDDLMAGVDAVIEMGVAHPDSLLLMGWSYGGYMTSFAVTRTDRFQAASMGAGLPNLVSMTTTTDIQDYLVAHMGAEFWEDYEVYERHSAMYRIANVTTPTQVIHGAEDLRVPFTQGQEFYRALARRGIPTEMVVLPRTPHGPSEPKLLMEVSQHILRWFETHLGRPRGG